MRPRFVAAALASILVIGSSVRAADLQEIVVREGDTLWSIANHYLQDPNKWPEILKYNNLSLADPTAALPGMKLKVPVMMIKEEYRKADLVYLLKDVLFRRRSLPDWKKARADLDLYNEDGLRTMAESEAHVKFYSGDILKLSQNSLVILKPLVKREEANLLAGVVRAGRTRVITPTAEVNPRSADTIYKARVRPDKATIVQVERGSTEVVGVHTRKSVIVSEGFANITLPKGNPSSPVKVPNLPGYEIANLNDRGELVASVPADKAPGLIALKKRADQKQAAAEEKQAAADNTSEEDWSGKAKDYRIQVSPDKEFRRISLDRK